MNKIYLVYNTIRLRLDINSKESFILVLFLYLIVNLITEILSSQRKIFNLIYILSLSLVFK